MADDGAWQIATEVGAHQRFHDVLAEFAERLASPTPIRRETAVALVQQLERLGLRMAGEQALAVKREAEFAARIDDLLAELAEARASKRALPVRTLVAAVAACAAVGGAVALTPRSLPKATPGAAMPVEVAAIETPLPAPEDVAPANELPADRIAPPPRRVSRKEVSTNLRAAIPEPPPAAEPALPEPAVEPTLNEASLKDTQTFLAQQGYYIGPIDGQVSVTLKDAAEAYLRDHKVATLR